MKLNEESIVSIITYCQQKKVSIYRATAEHIRNGLDYRKPWAETGSKKKTKK